MVAVKFEDITDALKTGREIEFTYNQKKYSITNSNGFWRLCSDTDTPVILETICASSERTLLAEKIKNISIEGVSIPDIFDNAKYDLSSLYIL